jgi:hypothetical protein
MCCKNRLLRQVGYRGRRKTHDEEFHDLNSSPNIISVIKSKKMRSRACSTYRSANVYVGFVFKETGREENTWQFWA